MVPARGTVCWCMRMVVFAAGPGHCQSHAHRYIKRLACTTCTANGPSRDACRSLTRADGPPHGGRHNTKDPWLGLGPDLGKVTSTVQTRLACDTYITPT